MMKFAFFAALPLLVLIDLLPVHASEIEHFALLVGVNEYAQPSNDAYRVTPLKGPANDVALIRSLLPKYGFKDDQKHILTLLGEQASHANIEQAFKTQLIDNASKYPNAIFLFYFSGHGSRAYNVAPGDSTTHDTLVAYDSRADKGTDILDNELVDWFEELRKQTSDITFILDSCHSGSAIKDVGTMVARELPPNPRQSASARNLSSRDAPSASGGYYIPRRNQFALLSASLDYESSYENQIEPAGRVHGYFTYYLAQVLQQEPNISNERAVNNTALALAKVSPYQHPLAVGNIEGLIFGGSGNLEDPYIRMSDPIGDTFQVMAGAPLGIREGAFLAIYEPTARHLVGDNGKLANARVTQVGITSSTAALSDKPKSPLSKDDKVVVVTPFFGFEKLRIRTADLPNQPTGTKDQQILQQVADSLNDNTLISSAKKNEDWDIAVRRGCIVQGKLVVSAEIPALAMPCKTFVYYLTSKGDAPLLGFQISADDVDAGNKIAGKVILLAKQENIRALDNAVSPLKGKVRIKLIKVDVGVDGAGRPIIASRSDPTNDGPQPLKIGQNFQLQVTNNTNQKIYAATFMLGTSGAIELITVNPNGDPLDPGESAVTHAPRQVGGPLGRETYKVFASTSPTVDYRVLEQPSLTSKDVSSPFEWLLNQTTNIRIKDSTVNKNIDLSDWTTATLDVIVEP